MFLAKDKNRSQYWQIVFTVNGKRTKKTTNTTDKNEAKKILQLFKQNYPDQELNRVVIDKIENTFMLEDFKKEYITFMEGFASESYVERSIKPAFKELLAYTGNIPIKNLNVRLLEGFLIGVYKRSKYTAANYYRSIKSALTKAQSWNYIDKNYLKDFKLPKIQKSEPLFITYEELQKIVNEIKDQTFKNITLFAFFTGLRCGEIVSLTWTNIKLKEMTIQIGSNDFATKSRRIRFIPISTPVLEILNSIKPNVIELNKTFVFTRADGSAYSVDYVSKTFKSAVYKSKINSDVHFHTLRSSFGSYLLQRGVPIQMISKLLGHSSIAITEAHYASLTIGNLFDAVSQFNNLKVLNQ